MKITITAGTSTFRISGQTVAVDGVGCFEGRLLNEIKLARILTGLGSVPATLNLSVRNDDGFISSSVDLWNASVVIESESGKEWHGKITAYDSDGAGVVYLVVTEKSAPELSIQIPDEVARLVSVDENFHVSAVNATLPLVIGGNSSKPILVKGILIDKVNGIYLLCVGEIHQVVKVFRGTEELSTGFSSFTGTSGQASYPGFAYVQLTDEELRKNDDGTYSEISAEVIGLKLGTHTIEECRNGARFLYWLLKTAKDGINGWGLGISESDINSTAFNTAISRVDSAGLKLDGIFYFRQYAQSWIDQICQAIRGTYEIGENGKRRLFINASASSKKTYSSSNIALLRFGKGAFTGRVFNKCKLDFDYNPITGSFMQSASYQDSSSIDEIEEQEFYGQSYLIKDMTTAQAILEYACKKSLIGAQKVYFETIELPEDVETGDIITINYPEKGLSGDWQIIGLEIGDWKHKIEAEKFDSSIFTVGTPGTAIDWAYDPPVVSPVLPGQASGLSLSPTLDTNPDGTATVGISGTFELPAGGYIGASVLWGEGDPPTAWNDYGLIKNGQFQLTSLKPGTKYYVKVQMISSTGKSDFVTSSITTIGDTEAPGVPSFAVTSYLKTVTIKISLASPPSDLAGFKIYRNVINDFLTALPVGSVTSKDGEATAEDKAPEYGQTYYYWVTAFDTWKNESGHDSAQSTIIVAISGTDIVDGALSRSSLFAAGVVDATAIGAAAVTAAKTAIAAIDAATGNLNNGVVTELKLADDAVTAAKLNVAAIDATGAIAAGAVAELQLANDAVTAAKLAVAGIDGVTGAVAAGAVAELQLADDAVTAAKLNVAAIDATGAIADNAVTELKIAADAVTEAKIAAAAVNTAQINNAALKAPLGAVASWSAKNCTTSSIAEAGGVRDVSGNGNHGRAYGAVSIVEKDIGSAFEFSGGYINGPMVELGGAWSFSFWCERYNSLTKGVLAFVFSSGAKTIRFFFEPTYLELDIYGGPVELGNIGAAVGVNELAFIVGTYDGTYLKLYKNGALAASASVAIDPPGTGFMHLASFANGAFSGYVAHLKMFNRSLSAAEIKSLYMFPEDAAFGNITADLVTTGELITQTAQIKDAIITSAKISDLSADKINAGTLAAARIAAGSLTADKITGTAIVVGGAAGDVNAGATTISGGKITANSITASQIQSATITSAEIAANTIVSGNITTGEFITLSGQIKDAIITNAKISDLSAEKINAGTIAADRIAAGSLAADKITGGALVVGGAAADVNSGVTTISGGKITANTITAREVIIGDFTNVVTNPCFCKEGFTTEPSSVGWTGATGISANTAGVPAGASTPNVGIQSKRDALFLKYIDVKPGETWAISLECVTPDSPYNFGAGFFVYDKDFIIINYLLPIRTAPVSGWTTISGMATMPAGAVRAVPWTQINGVSGFGNWYFTNVRYRKAASGDLIVDGAITTDKVAANAITSAKVTTGELLTLSAQIKDAIVVNSKIANLDAAKITTGSLDAARIAAGSISAEKIASGAISTAKLDVAAIKFPAGAVADWSAKGSTTESIAVAGGVIDISGNSNHGQAFGGVEVVDTEIGKAFSFDGVNDYLSFPANLPETAWTMALWMKSGSDSGISGQIAIITADGRRMRVFKSNAIAEFDVIPGELGNLHTIVAVADGWNHLVASYDGTTMFLYKNGMLIASSNQTISAPGSSVTIEIGRIYSSYFNGQIAHPKIYNRALTLAEVVALYMIGGDNETGQITADRIIAGAIDTNKLAAGAVVASKISAGAIEAAAIAANAVEADKILAGAITTEKINVTALRLPGNERTRLSAKGIASPVNTGTGFIKDASGNGIHATATGGVTATEITGVCKAFGFDGTNDYVETISNIGWTSGFSISCWFRPSAVSGSTRRTIAAVMSGNSGFVAEITESKLQITFGMGAYQVSLRPADLAANTNYHLVVAIGSGSHAIYLNGASVSSSSAGPAAANVPLLIGKYSTGFFTGTIGNITAYLRKLTAAEAKALYMTDNDAQAGVITADRVVTGQIKSLNYSTTAGSMINLDSGDIEFGGSDLPTFSWSNTDKTGNIGTLGFEIVTTNNVTNSYMRHTSLGSKTAAHTSAKVYYDTIPYSTNNGTYFVLSHGAISSNGEKSIIPHIDMETVLNGITRAIYINAPFFDQTSTGNIFTPIYVETGSSSAYAMSTNARIFAGGGFFPTSDESVKSDINDVNVLDGVKQLRVKVYRLDDKKIKQKSRSRQIANDLKEKNAIVIKNMSELLSDDLPEYNPCHSIGVMAADFNKVFKTGREDTETYNITDALGVALRAIQELAEIVDDLKAENEELRAACNLPKRQKKEKTKHVYLTDEEREYIKLAENMTAETRAQIKPHVDEIMLKLRS